MLSDPPPIEALAATAGIAGTAGQGPDIPELVSSVADFESRFGSAATTLARMARGFFANGGTHAYIASSVRALEAIDDVALLCPAPAGSEEAIAQCERRRDRVAILSLRAGLSNVEEVLASRPIQTSAFAAVHHPWVWAGGELTPPGGHVAGMYVSSDAARTVPTAKHMVGLDDPPLERSLSELEIAALLDGSINPLRDLRATGDGVRIWAARALDPNAEFRSLPVRRLIIFLERSIWSGLRWVALAPNDDALWTRVRNAVAAFLMTQWRAGTLKGRTPEAAFFVRCDRTTMTQQDLDEGRLICLVGVALVQPAEFVIFRIGQSTRPSSTRGKSRAPRGGWRSACQE